MTVAMDFGNNIFESTIVDVVADVINNQYSRPALLQVFLFVKNLRLYKIFIKYIKFL